jgi:hypothetical protein
VNEEQAKAKIIAQEKQFFESLPEKDKQFYKGFRLSFTKSLEESWNDKNNWWNRLATMKDEELDLLPDAYIRKFGSFFIRKREME